MTEPAARRPIKIVLFSDGTGNSSAKLQKTNVWRLFQALDQQAPDQLAKYDDGVGTSSNKYLALLGGAFGWGLKRNVIDLYKFVCRNYHPGDNIYGFGFSRGAFTIRVLVGLIAREGLVTFRSEEELARHAAAAYRSFRYKAFPSKSPIVWVARALRDGVLYLVNRVKAHRDYNAISEATRQAQRKEIPIRFLGLWDTVEAYGMPIVELKRGIDWVLWPMLFGDLKLALSVQRAVHALSLDDERTTFHPLLWDEEWEATQVADRKAPAGRISQVWFAGVHSNVGGGYPEDQLSMVPLEWILREAEKCGLSLIPNRVNELSLIKSPYARLYDSRAGLAAYYRYSPRQTPRPCYNGSLVLANIHHSVLKRMVYGSDSYAPITLPHAFNVLTPTGDLREFHHLARGLGQHPQTTSGDVDLDAAIQALGNPDRDAVSLVWDTVFWRRCVYAATMLLTGLALAFPLLANVLPPQLANAEAIARGPILVIVRAFGALIPSFASPWKISLERYPLEFGLALIGIAITLLGSQTLEARIHDRARLVWHTGPIVHYREWRTQRRQGFKRTMLFCILLLAIASLTGLAIDNPSLTVECGVAAVLAALVTALSIVGSQPRQRGSSGRVQHTTALHVARLLRENPLLIALYGGLTQKVLPIAFALSLVVVGVLLANRAIFDTVSSAGAYCTASVKDQITESIGKSARVFATNEMCWPSGLVLNAGHRYLITLDTPVDSPTDNTTHRWFDRDIPTDVMGFPSDSRRHRLARPLARWWTDDWFKPIARIGRFGNDEYVLRSVDDVKPFDRPACLSDLHMPSEGRSIRAQIDPALAKRINACAPLPADRKVLRAEIDAKSTGELFLYVNDAILAIPGLSTMFVDNNSGSATVEVERLRPTYK